MKKFKISESRIRKVIRQEINRALLEQFDGPVGMDLQLGAERARQGRNPRTGAQETEPIQDSPVRAPEPTTPWCRKVGTPSEPGYSYFQPENRTFGYIQNSSGHVELTHEGCGPSEGVAGQWSGETSTLNGAIRIFFDQEGMGGMVFQPRSGPRAHLSEWWLANQLLKYDVGFSRRRDRVVDIPEPAEIDYSDMDSIMGGGPMEESLIKEDDTDARNPSNPTDYSQWSSRDGFDNPYAQDIYEKLYDANTATLRNRADPDRIKELAERLYQKQIEIKGDARKALIAVYDCYEMGPVAGVGRYLLDKIGMDPLGEAGSYCQFMGWTLNPANADRKRRTYIT